MAYLSMAAQGVGLISSLMGMQSGKDAARFKGAADANMALINAENTARAAEARAAADTFNATVAEQLAVSESERAGAEAGDFRRAQNARVASSHARQAASGLALEGSPLLVNETMFQEIEFGAQRIAYGGQLASSRARNQASLLNFSSKIETDNARRAREAGKITADYALQAGELNADAAQIKGFGDMFKGLSGFGSTLAGRGTSWGGIG